METRQLCELISLYFDEVIEKYHFQIVPVGKYEVILANSNCLLLICAGRDGVSIRYILADGKQLPVVSLGHFLIGHRKIYTTTDLEKYDGFEKEVRHLLSSYALTLARTSDDILSGDDKWFDKTRHSYLSLSEHKSNSIKTALRKAGRNSISNILKKHKFRCR